jgi:hypothetical protein
MGEYRIYQLTRTGMIDTVHEVAAVDDADAFSRAMELREQYGCEIWEGRRLVGRVPGLQHRPHQSLDLSSNRSA